MATDSAEVCPQKHTDTHILIPAEGLAQLETGTWVLSNATETCVNRKDHWKPLKPTGELAPK